MQLKSLKERNMSVPPVSSPMEADPNAIIINPIKEIFKKSSAIVQPTDTEKSAA